MSKLSALSGRISRGLEATFSDLIRLQVDTLMLLLDSARRRLLRKPARCRFCVSKPGSEHAHRTIFHALRYHRLSTFQRLCPCARPEDDDHPDGPWCVLAHPSERRIGPLIMLLTAMACGWLMLAGGGFLGWKQLRGYRPVTAPSTAGKHSPRDPMMAGKELESARGLMELNNYTEARIHLLKALKLDPEHPDIHLELARCALHQGATDQSYRYYQRALGLAPANWDIRLELAALLLAGREVEQASLLLVSLPRKAGSPEGLQVARSKTLRAHVHLHHGRRAEAVDLLREVAERENLDPELMYSAGSLLLNAGALEPAEKLFRALTDLEPDRLDGHASLSAVLRIQGMHDEARKALARAEDLDADAAETRIQRAELMLMEGASGTAIKEYRSLAQAHPRHPGIQSRLASVLLEQGRLDAALEQAELICETHELREAQPVAHYLQAELYRRQGFHSKSLRHARRAVEAKPGVARFQFVFGQSLLALDRPLEALSAFEAASKLEADLVAPRIQVARALRALGRFPLAEETLQRAVQDFPDSILPALELGTLYYMQAEYDKARPMLEQVLELAPENESAINNLAFILADRKEDLQRAEQLARLLFDRRPGDPNAADLLGWVLVQQGKIEPGLQHLEFAARYIHDNPYMQYHLGVAHLLNGEPQRARILLEEALAFPGRFAASEAASKLLETLPNQ